MNYKLTFTDATGKIVAAIVENVILKCQICVSCFADAVRRVGVETGILEGQLKTDSW